MVRRSVARARATALQPSRQPVLLERRASYASLPRRYRSRSRIPHRLIVAPRSNNNSRNTDR